jgi:hypothetical protein
LNACRMKYPNETQTFLASFETLFANTKAK